ncbi:malonate decarboxylase holo-ACP synthase [Pseudomonas sp. ES3-33]|uniref:malonate decarboxylase holo-ACP synthase n=1 Tax=Pseudomonas sp. ES3-33 TaxID=1628833 RepID=UPI0005D369E7|nr:malonate decarboxylase holo-ACP synthase [Pseudomonas sp. ES3-33]KJH76798.1 phosphoribosyl-dephospho-CoA transferase [Pseudomonas sp. ES3-33]
MVNVYLAHDLLWGMTVQQLPADAPEWVFDSIRAGHPVVVRRALGPAGEIPVGVRGRLREHRFAAGMRVDSVRQRVQPESLCHVSSERDLPALHALKHLRPMLDDCGWVWGVSGSAGFELASAGFELASAGFELARAGFHLASAALALHPHSDLDLILRTPEPLPRLQARELLKILDSAACPVDMQLQTPLGAVALREWAGRSDRVLLKQACGACLTADPWNQREQAA